MGARSIEQLCETLKGSDIRLSLDAIDTIVPAGVTLDSLEKGWTPDWLQAENEE